MPETKSYPRKFTLVNGRGESISLNSKDSFGYDPSGLGIEMDQTMIQSSHGSIVTNSQYAQTTIKMSMVFGYVTEPYESFHDVVSKIAVAPLTLYYDVPNVGQFERSVALKILAKGDVNHETNLIGSDIELEVLSPWRKWVQAHGAPMDISVQKPKGYYDNGNYMGYSYDYIYNAGQHTSGYAMELDNQSVVPGVDQYTGIKIIFNAERPVVNPTISILAPNYSVLQTETIYTTLYQGSTFTMNTAFGEEEYSLRNNTTGVTDDISRYVDPSSTGFLQVPIGKSIIQLGNSFHSALTDVNDPNLEVWVLNEWGGV